MFRSRVYRSRATGRDPATGRSCCRAVGHPREANSYGEKRAGGLADRSVLDRRLRDPRRGTTTPGVSRIVVRASQETRTSLESYPKCPEFAALALLGIGSL